VSSVRAQQLCYSQNLLAASALQLRQRNGEQVAEKNARMTASATLTAHAWRACQAGPAILCCSSFRTRYGFRRFLLLHVPGLVAPGNR